MTRRHWISLWLTSVALALVIVAPIFGPGYLLIRDMVSTPRSFPTDSALGLADSAPRAVPQDWLMAVTSSVLDGGIVVKALTFAALVLAGVGYGRLARRTLPAAGAPGMLTAAVITVWNPFVAERLLQGQWSLLFGYAALGWIFVAVVDVRRDGGWATWSMLAGWCAVAGITPTGSVLAGFALFAVLVMPALARRDWQTTLVAAAVWIASAIPWLAASILGSGTATADPASVALFAARAEPWLGTVGSLVGLGGVWNADAVPESRTSPWALVATAALMTVVIAGLPGLARRRRNRVICAAGVLAVGSLALVAVAATPFGMAILEWLVDTVPGAGLLRDTQKWVALAAPVYALAAASAVQTCGRFVPKAFAAVVASALIVAPLPDLAWGVGNTLTPIRYPADWQRAADTVTAGRGDVLVLPVGTNRRYAFAGSVSLDPAPRLLRADVLQSGELLVDGRSVDRPDSRATRAEEALLAGSSPATLAELGVGWVLVEGDSATGASPRTLAQLDLAFDGSDLRVYRVDGARLHSASASEVSTSERAAMWSAHLAWIVLIANGLLAAVLKWAHRTAHRKRLS
jgi:hypothetical protein